MHSYNKNKQLFEKFKEYQSRFEKITKELNVRISKLSGIANYKNKIQTEKSDYLFREWLEKYHELVEIDFYKKKDNETYHILDDKSSLDAIFKGYNYFDFWVGWKIKLTGKIFILMKKLNFY